MEEVYPGIFRIKEKHLKGSVRPEVNFYLIAGNNGLIFDSGHGDKKSIKYALQEIERIKNFWKKDRGEFNINRILISHAHGDHFSGASGLKKNLDLNIILTEKIASIVTTNKKYYNFFKGHIPEKNYVSTSFFVKFPIDVIRKTNGIIFRKLFQMKFINKPDIIISDKSKITINDEEWQIFPSPGHCPAHISLYNEEKGILFSGDNILRSIITWLGPPKSNLAVYLKTLKEIRNLPKLELILGGHGSPVIDPKKRIDDIIKWRKKRTNEILEIIKKNGNIKFNNLMKILYPNSSFTKRQMIASGWVQLTLDYLEEEGKIKRKIIKKIIYFYCNKDC